MSEWTATWNLHFYPRSPCGERRRAGTSESRYKHFYPRSPCGERLKIRFLFRLSKKFLSTLSLRRATKSDPEASNHQEISIHALLAESDQSGRFFGIYLIIISIHALLAESDSKLAKTSRTENISIHALLAESDGFSRPLRAAKDYFYPRSPCGERPDWQKG